MKNCKPVNACYKILLLVILILNGFLSHAQNDAVRQEIDRFFANVDKAQANTKLLKEYGYQFVNVATYNGVLADSNVVDANALRMLYASLLSGNDTAALF